MRWVYDLVERGAVPDPLIQVGIRRLLARRLSQITPASATNSSSSAVFEQMRLAPIALNTAEANEQHYELPAALFQRMLGPRLKYSCCFWPPGTTTLAAAEEAALAETCKRAGIVDGMSVLELGCGWGSLTLWLAEHYPNSKISAVSNSQPQRTFIEARRDEAGLTNLDVTTADMNGFDPGQRFDRVISIEMFEHMRNYRELLARIASWLNPEGRLLVHVFCHRSSPYFFEDRGPNDWMARHFFTGGLMPSADIFTHFDDDLEVEQTWRWDGQHYEKTLRSWLTLFDRQRSDCRSLMASIYGPENAARWHQRWRLFLLACAELFGYRQGQEWFVTHTRLKPLEKTSL